MLQLVAEGRTNRMIATELLLSERTVQRHLSNIFGKPSKSAPAPRRRRSLSSRPRSPLSRLRCRWWGIEPTRPLGQSILSAPRLPFRHTGLEAPRQNTVGFPVTDTEDTQPAPRRVVVAEDESLIRLDIVEILRDNGYEVVGEAGDGGPRSSSRPNCAPTWSSWT